MSDNEQENESMNEQENESMESIVAEMRSRIAVKMGDAWYTQQEWRNLCDRIEAAWKRERELLRSCARWISTHDIYGHMAQELLAECKKVLGDDGKFLMPKEV